MNFFKNVKSLNVSLNKMLKKEVKINVHHYIVKKVHVKEENVMNLLIVVILKNLLYKPYGNMIQMMTIRSIMVMKISKNTTNNYSDNVILIKMECFKNVKLWNVKSKKKMPTERKNIQNVQLLLNVHVKIVNVKDINLVKKSMI